MAPESSTAEAVNVLDMAGLTADGVYLVGEYLGLRDERAREVAGRTLQGCSIGVRLAGGTIETISYGSRKYAEDAAAGLARSDRAAFRIEIRHGSKDGRPWMFYQGARSTGESSSAFAEEFKG